jgi:HK97 family phage prohead protease
MSAHKFVSAGEFRAAARRGDAGGLGVRASAHVLKNTNDDSPIVGYVLSDPTIDLVGDSINQDGWDLSQIRRNNPVHWNHDSTILPVGRLHNVRVRRPPPQLLGDVEFAVGVSEFADQVFRMVKAGFLRGGSVGFVPQEWEYDPKRHGINFHRQKLIEFSITSQPCNENALVRAKSMGFKTDLLINPPRRKAKSEPMSVKQRELWVAEILLEVAGYELIEAVTHDEFARAMSKKLRAQRALGMLESGDWRT